MIIFNWLGVGIILFSWIIGYILASPILLFHVNSDTYSIIASGIAVIAMTIIDAPQWQNGKKGGQVFFIPIYMWGALAIIGSVLYGVWQLLVAIYQFIINNGVIAAVGGVVLFFCIILLVAITKSDMSTNQKRRIVSYIMIFTTLTIVSMIGYNPVKTFVFPPPTLTPTLTPTLAPTRTLAPTNTPKPTRTPKPTEIPAECIYNCAEIEVINTTGGPLTFSVSGIGKSSWSIVVGTTTIKVNPGFYTITAVARCGTDTDTITVVEGITEQVTYYCSSVP